MTERKAAETFPPGGYIKEELDSRGWSQNDLADILGRPPRLISEIISGKRSITPETAKGLGDAFETGAQLWMNLEGQYQLSSIKNDDGTVARRAKLYKKFPVKEMLRRNWIKSSANIDVLQKRFFDFFGINSFDETPNFPHAARKSTSYQQDLTSAQQAWLFRALQLAKTVSADKFSDESLATGLERLRMILPNAGEIRQVPRILAESGIRFLVVEPLPKTRIDGVCFWINPSSPVIVLSLRYDRIDGFWHTLLHEIGHVKNRDGMGQLVLDTDLVGDQARRFEEKPEIEQRADRFACEFSIPKTELDGFISRIQPLYSKQKIRRFADRMKVHPAIVVGQLQYRGEITYAHSREMLIKIRQIVTEVTLTDGWDCYPSVAF